MLIWVFSLSFLIAQADTTAIKEKAKKDYQEARNLFLADKTEAAFQILDESISLLTSIGDHQALFSAQTLRASMLLQVNRYDELDQLYSIMESHLEKVDKRLQCFFWFNKAQYLDQVNKYEESYQALLKGKPLLHPELVDYPILFYGYHLLYSQLEKKFKNYKRSRELLHVLEDSLTSLTFPIERRSHYLIDLYNALGNLSKETEDFLSADEYFKKALQYASNIKDQAMIKHNMASLWAAQKRFDEAEAMLHSLQDTLIRKSTLFKKYFTLSFIYEGKEEKKKYSDNLANFNRLMKKQNYPNLAIHLHLLNAIGAYFVDDFHRSLKLSQKALKVYEEHKEGMILSRQLAEKYILLSQARLHNNDDLHREFDHLLSLKDSINAFKNAEDYKELHIKYQTEQRQRENEKLEFEKKMAERAVKEKNTMLWLGGTALGVISLLTFFLSFLYRSSQRKNADIINQRNQIEVLNQELNHRVKNNLAFISSLIKMQSRRSDSQQVKEALQESESRLLALSGVHNQLYRNNAGRDVEIREYLTGILEGLEKIFSTEEKPIHFHTSFVPMQMNAEDAMKLGIIMNELITNSVKYAFDDITNPVIDIKTSVNQAGILTFQYTDNGPGYSHSIRANEMSKSLGLKLIELLKAQLSERCVIVM